MGVFPGIDCRVHRQAAAAQCQRHLGHLGDVQAHLIQLIGAGEHLTGRALHEHMAVRQDHDAVHIAGDLLHAVAHQHHRGVFRPMIVLNAGQNIIAATGIQTRRGLVQHQHLGFHGDNAGDGHAALLSAGQLEG